MVDIANDLGRAERETHLNMVADDRDQGIAFTDDPVMARKLAKVGKLIWTDGKSAKFRLASSQVRFFRLLSEEERQERSQRAQKHLVNAD